MEKLLNLYFYLNIHLEIFLNLFRDIQFLMDLSNESWLENSISRVVNFYIIEGSITLTSADGSVLTSGAGETLSIPKEWTGIWETDGYSKIWAIYYGESKD